MSGVRSLGIALAVLNLILWFSVPALRALVDGMTGRWADPDNPRIVTGVQELLVYFDPWLARAVFPLIYTAGFAAIPFLLPPSDVHTDPRPGRAGAVLVALLLLGLEGVWLALIAIGVFLRGPNWNLFWPGERWDADRVVPLNFVDLSDHVWVRLMGRPVEGLPWAVREFPGFVLLGGYLLAGLILAYGLYRAGRRPTPYWRWVVLVVVLQIAALVPLKIMSRWVFSIKYWIFLPEFFWNV